MTNLSNTLKIEGDKRSLTRIQLHEIGRKKEKLRIKYSEIRRLGNELNFNIFQIKRKPSSIGISQNNTVQSTILLFL